MSKKPSRIKLYAKIKKKPNVMLYILSSGNAFLKLWDHKVDSLSRQPEVYNI